LIVCVCAVFFRFFFSEEGGGKCGRTCPLHAAQALLHDLPESRPFSRQSAVRIFFLRVTKKSPKTRVFKKKNAHAVLRDDCVLCIFFCALFFDIVLSEKQGHASHPDPHQHTLPPTNPPTHTHTHTPGAACAACQARFVGEAASPPSLLPLRARLPVRAWPR
jgi:hypothetical protein